MGIRMVRQPSETPNVTNIDDIIPFRYAYGDQNGYVIGKGTEISYTIEGNTFRVNSGRVVLQGVETDIDANGVSFTIDNSSETRYFVVYYEVNLVIQTTAIKLSDYSTNGYPSIDTGDDLTANASGIARTELYRFTATSGVISNVTKTAKAIEYSGTALVGYDINKGTVEQRLSRLGFRSGSAQSTLTGAVLKNQLKRQGNYVLMEYLMESTGYDYNWDRLSIQNSVCRIPENFLPNETIETVGFAHLKCTGLSYANWFGRVRITSNGVVQILDDNLSNNYKVYYLHLIVGYEAKPLE